MPSRDLGYPVFDADNHMYEKTEALTKFLPPGYQHLAYVQQGMGMKVNNGLPGLTGPAVEALYEKGRLWLAG